MKTIHSLLMVLTCSCVAQAELTGVGLVVGLNQTGGKSELVRMFLPKVAPKTCSICMIMGTRRGNKVQFKVTPLDGATSLQGGMLVATRLFGPDAKPHAVVSGAIRKRKNGHRFDWFGETTIDRKQ